MLGSGRHQLDAMRPGYSAKVLCGCAYPYSVLYSHDSQYTLYGTERGPRHADGRYTLSTHQLDEARQRQREPVERLRRHPLGESTHLAVDHLERLRASCACMRVRACVRMGVRACVCVRMGVRARACVCLRACVRVRVRVRACARVRRRLQQTAAREGRTGKAYGFTVPQGSYYRKGYGTVRLVVGGRDACEYSPVGRVPRPDGARPSGAALR